MRAQRCDLTRPPPRPRPTVRPLATPEWSAHNVSTIAHRRFDVFGHERVPWFSPYAMAGDGWTAAVRSSQFPPSCGRALPFEDDLQGIGLGFTLPFIVRLMMIAMREYGECSSKCPWSPLGTRRIARRGTSTLPNHLRIATAPPAHRVGAITSHTSSDASSRRGAIACRRPTRQRTYRPRCERGRRASSRGRS